MSECVCSRVVCVSLGLALYTGMVGRVHAQDPWADRVVTYEPGDGAAEGFTNPQTALGSPERFTGEGVFPGAVTPFNPPWRPNEIVSMGRGGHLTVRFDEPIRNDPAHPFGVDLLIFGNGGFIDRDWPNGIVDGLFAEDGFTVSVSADGDKFVPLPGRFNDGFFPMLGYLDLTGPYDKNPGKVPSDFTRPVNPDLTLDDFIGKTFKDIVAMYDGAGGGIPFDIAASGLDEVFFVRLDVPRDATGSPEIDGFAAVPEPATLVLFGGGWALLAARRKRRRAPLLCEQCSPQDASDDGAGGA